MQALSVRDKQVQRVILIEGAANLLVLLAKLVVGLSTGSMAIIADAVHSLTDISNNVVAWIVIRFSSQPADREHPYGHRKFETLAVFLLASLLMVLAFELALNAIRKEATEVASSGLQVGIMFAVLGVNILVSRWQARWAKRLDSDLLRADASHTFADALTTLVVIAGWQLSVIGYLWVDRLCALSVSVIIVYLAFNLYRRTLPVLVDEYAIKPEELSRLIKKVHGVKDVSRIRSRRIGKSCSVDLVISVDPALSTGQSHAIADQIEQLIEKKYHARDVSIHVEPVSEPEPGSGS